MLSIIIADDEADIIELCKALIDYPDAVVVGEAHNGLELFEQISQLHPDAVITDICMPGMTGLELIEKAKQDYPNVNFVVMSGYTDFQYAQTALRFGVWDYLLKPLKKAELNRILKKLDKHLQKEQSQEQHTVSMQSDLKASLETLRDRYIRDVWEKGVAIPLPQIGNTAILDLQNAALQCISFSIDSNFTATAAEAPQLAQQADSTMEKIRKLIGTVCRQSGGLTDWPFAACVLLFDHSSAEHQSTALLKQISQEIRTFNSMNNLIHLSAAASVLLPSTIEQIPEACHQAKAALKWRLEKKQSSVILYSAENELNLEALVCFSSTKWETNLQEAILQLDAAAAVAVIDAALHSPSANKAIPGCRHRFVEEIVHCTDQALSNLPLDNAPVHLPTDIFNILSGGFETEELIRSLGNWITQEIKSYRECAQNQENSVIRQAKQYVAQHYAENISLNQVAKHVCLSASYFSALFKTETGTGFIEYLQHTRIERAKKLLRNSKMRIADIAESVGYHDVKFFNKIFCKETSVTPSEYRKFYS